MRILLLYASAGTGHKRAAEALAAGFRAEAGDTEVLVRDILDFTPKLFRETYAKGYLRIVRHVPELWGLMYSHAEKKALIPWRRRVRSAFNKINTISFGAFYRRFAPDAVVCTHFLPLELLSARTRLGRRAAPLFCAVTDYAVHALWITKRVTCYYVATDEARRHMMRTGLPASCVAVTGIPIDPVFAERVAPAEARRRLGLEPGMPVVLILSGGFGVGPTLGLVDAFRQGGMRCQVLVVAGANETLRREAEALAASLPVPVRVFGFVNNVHELMDASDLVIGKSGGLTSSEVMAKGKPMLIVDPIPGQEQRNCEHLLECGAARRLYEVEDTPDRVREILGDAPALKRMQDCARATGRPLAAQTIAADVLRRAGR